MRSRKRRRAGCVDGIAANVEACRAFVDRSIGVVTALVPVIGYARSTELAAEAMRTGKGIVELVRAKRLLSDAQIAKLLDPRAMTSPGRNGRVRKG